MTIINPIQYFKSAYRASTGTRKIMPRGYTEGYFMKKSPLAKGGNLNVEEGYLSKFCKRIGKFFSM